MNVEPRFSRVLRGIWMLAALIGPGTASGATYTVSGTVKNGSGQGIANVDLDFIEYCTGANVFIVNDKTNGVGAYSIVVNAGTYDIHFTPPTGSTLAAAEKESVSVQSNQNLGVTVLPAGLVVSGTVKNQSGVGVANANLDFVDLSTGRKIYVPNDTTTVSGGYSVRVKSGTYDVEYRPPAATTYLTGLRKGLVVNSNVSGLVDTLGAGLRVFGTVRNEAGTAIERADLDFFDKCLGVSVPTAHDNSDAAGAFSVYVPPGTFSIDWTPPRCTSLGANRIGSLEVTGATDLGSIVLPDAVPVTGRILNSLGQPVINVDPNFYDAGTHALQATARDNSDASGNFKAYVPLGTYNINFRPPSDKDLLVGRVEGVPVMGPTSLGDIVLANGIPTSGTVVDPNNVGVRNVDVDVFDLASKTFVRLAHDNTAEDGTFKVRVPAGTYDYQYIPPECSPLAPTDQRDIDVNAPLTLPTADLVLGAHAMGFVLEQDASPVDNADLDFYPGGGGEKTFTARDNTNVLGFYDVLVPPSTYDINYIPPSESGLLPGQRFDVDLISDTTIPDTILYPAFTVDGFVFSDETGLPVENTDLDVFVPGSGTPLFTPGDNTDAAGHYSVGIGAGTWNIKYSPPTASGLAPRWRKGVVISSNTTLPDTLLFPLTVPLVASITPVSGSTAGGQSVTIGGDAFQPDATVKLGNVSAQNVNVVSSSTITALTPAHPQGLVDLVVTNPGNQPGSRTDAYTFNEPAVPIQLLLSKSGSDIGLTWTSTGQSTYTVFRSTTPTGWSNSSILATTSATSYTDVGGALLVNAQYYSVN